jgi:hypothetical protein
VRRHLPEDRSSSNNIPIRMNSNALAAIEMSRYDRAREREREREREIRKRERAIISRKSNEFRSDANEPVLRAYRRSDRDPKPWPCARARTRAHALRHARTLARTQARTHAYA